MGKIATRLSLAFSKRYQLSQAIPHFHVARMLHEWTPTAQFASQHNECRVYEDQFLCFGGRYERQRTASDSNRGNTQAPVHTENPTRSRFILATPGEFAIAQWSMENGRECCFESAVSEEKTHWVCFGTQILIGWEEPIELSLRSSARPKKLTELGVWNRARRNRMPVSKSKMVTPIYNCDPRLWGCHFLNFTEISLHGCAKA